MPAPANSSPSIRKKIFLDASPGSSTWKNYFLKSESSSPLASLVRQEGEVKPAQTTDRKVPTKIQDIEKIIGFVNEQYDCEHSNFAGTMYAGPLAVVWLGRIFFFEWTVVIKWEDVVQVQKRENGVKFLMRSKTTHEFVKLFNPEKAWASLVSLHNDSVIDQPRREPTPRQVIRSLRRMNSDPLKMSVVYKDGGRDSIRSGPSTPIRKKRDTIIRTASAPPAHDTSEYTETISDELEPEVKPTLEHQWTSAIEATYEEVAVESYELPCSLDSFLELFIDDKADYSIPSFMKGSGDEEIQCTSWTLDSIDGTTKTRTIEYTHPVNAPMAPPMARARKEQTIKVFGNHGLVLETRTYVSDVPMTDCFYVADQIRVEPTSEKSVAVTMSFDLEFVKSTMFKAIIVRTTKGEFQSSMTRLANFMSGSLGQAGSLEPPPAKETSAAPPSEWFPVFAAIFLTLLLLLQIWILIDMRSIKMAIMELQLSASLECPSKMAQLVDGLI